jgi:hypothetical protein
MLVVQLLQLQEVDHLSFLMVVIEMLVVAVAALQVIQPEQVLFPPASYLSNVNI